MAKNVMPHRYKGKVGGFKQFSGDKVGLQVSEKQPGANTTCQPLEVLSAAELVVKVKVVGNINYANVSEARGYMNTQFIANPNPLALFLVWFGLFVLFMLAES